MSGKRVAVVILGWNGLKFLKEFLPSVLCHTPVALCEIVVADNCSTDDSVTYVRDNFPQVTVIENSTNAGYAGGYNEALRKVDAEYFVLLNQDVEVSDGWIERVLDEMDKDVKIAAAQPKIRSFHRRNYFEYAGACGGFLDKYAYAFCRGRLFDTCEEDLGQYEDVCDIFWASGACLFIRSKAYWEAGGLDEDFFAHQEEIDLCWRLKNRDYRIISVPQSVVYHVGGGSLGYGNPRKTYLNFRNNLMMMAKNLPLPDLLWRMFIRFCLDGIAAVRSVRSERNFVTMRAILKAHCSFYLLLSALFNKRKNIPRKSASELSRFSVVWQYFGKEMKTYTQLPQR